MDLNRRRCIAQVSSLVSALAVCNRNNLSFRFLQNSLTLDVIPVRRKPAYRAPMPPASSAITGRLIFYFK
ncbi:hypothetical protein AB664_19330 [Brucella anthropi]|uniref:Uncharacterized protein n=1 Tax=Brucella anthropi TaxID=529 RepID=A0A656Z3Q0_BRUAN|nr:hypothetical protein AB664_19330 [Brucella anthropi]